MKITKLDEFLNEQSTEPEYHDVEDIEFYKYSNTPDINPDNFTFKIVCKNDEAKQQIIKLSKYLHDKLGTELDGDIIILNEFVHYYHPFQENPSNDNSHLITVGEV